ncbi:MAG: fumarylacetoacetate hydrolase family protein, partial [Sphingomonas sp.]
MKLASLKHGRDGKLVVVSSDLAWFADATHIAPTLQAALDNWNRVLPDLQNLSTDLDHEVIPMQRFHEHQAAAPLPRAYQWADGSAYVNHVALVRQARGADMPDSFWHDPLMYQGGSDGFLGARDAIPLMDEAWGCDLEAEAVVVTGDVPMGASR